MQEIFNNSDLNKIATALFRDDDCYSLEYVSPPLDEYGHSYIAGKNAEEVFLRFQEQTSKQS